MGPVAALLPDGRRLHLQHGPIDLIIGVDGDRARAFAAAKARFATVLSEIMAEIAILRRSDSKHPAVGQIAQFMQTATAPFQSATFVTPMAAVAGSVAQTVLAAMVEAAEPDRAYVNNGGDIAIHLTPGQRFRMAMAAHHGRVLGQIDIGLDDPVRGIATSGRHGRSFSLGIADSVTVLAGTAAAADVASTLIANAVDLPGHRAIQRRPAHLCDANSDLGDRLVVTGCGALTDAETHAALRAGQSQAQRFVDRGYITGACLFLNDQTSTAGARFAAYLQGTQEYA